LFVEYNKKYFDSYLILPKMSTFIGETSMGLFTAREGRYTKYGISIARNFNLTKEELRDLLIHEMIHQYLYMKSRKASHGKAFKNMMDELNRKYGLDVRINSKHLFRKYRNKHFSRNWLRCCTLSFLSTNHLSQ